MLNSSGIMSLGGTTVNSSIALEWGLSGTSSVNMNAVIGTWLQNVDYSQKPTSTGGIIFSTPYYMDQYYGKRAHGCRISGGLDTSGVTSTRIQKYIIYQNQWASVNFLGTATYGSAGASNYAVVHWMSGWDATSVRSYVYKLDSYTEAVTVQTGIRSCALGAATSDITYAVYGGGYDGGNYLNTTLRWVWSNSTYAAGAVLASVRYAPHGGCSISNTGIFGGGLDAAGTRLATVDRYIFSSNFRGPTAALATATSYFAGSGNATYGVTAGGDTSAASGINTTSKLTYSNSTRVAGLALGRSMDDLAGTGANGYCIFAGGWDTTVGITTYVDRYLPGTTDARVAITVLDYAVDYPAGAGSSESGVTG